MLWRNQVSTLLLLAVLSAPSAARAAEPTAEDRERARALLFDGRDKLKAGDAEAAVRCFQAAHAIMGVPTTGLDLAKGLMALGKLIQARTVALDVSRMPPAAGEPAAFVKARESARKLAEELVARIPALVITTKDPPGGGAAQVTVDGAQVPADVMGLPWRVDPGEHVVTAEAPGFQAERRTVRVAEGATATVELTLSPGIDTAPPLVAQGISAPPARHPGPHVTPEGRDVTTAEVEARRRMIPSWVWISGGAGIIAIGAGVAFAVDYANVRSRVAGDCPDASCDWRRYTPADADQLEQRWDRSLGLAVGLGAVGLLGVGSAVIGVMTAPSAPPRDTPRRSVSWTPWLGVEAAGATVRGRF